MIALDLLFGERDSSVDSTCRRAAVVTHQHLNLSPKATIKKMKTLYDARSRYVHGGQQIDKQSVGQVEEVCVIVLSTLMRARWLGEQVDDPGFIEKWLKGLDFLWSAHEAQRVVNAEDLAALGIA